MFSSDLGSHDSVSKLQSTHVSLQSKMTPNGLGDNQGLGTSMKARRAQQADALGRGPKTNRLPPSLRIENRQDSQIASEIIENPVINSSQKEN